MANAKVLDIYGSEASFVSGHKLTIPFSEEMFFNLSRLGLSHCERAIVQYVMACRYSVGKRQIPSIRKMAADIGMSYSHARRCVKRLEELGLQVKRSPGRRALLFVRNLFLRLRKLIDTNKREARPKREKVKVQAPIPLPVPEPEPEPAPPPPAAAMPPRAPEWELAFPEIQKHVSHAEFKTWFEGTRAYRYKGLLVIEVRSTYHRQRLLMTRFSDLIDSLFGAGCWAVHIAEASA